MTADETEKRIRKRTKQGSGVDSGRNRETDQKTENMPSPNGIKAIFYDLDGTLRTSVPVGRVAFAAQAAALGLEISAETLQRAALWEHRYFAESPELVSDRAAFHDDSRAFWTTYGFRQLQALGASPEQARELAPQLNAYMGAHYKPADIIFEDVHATLRTLRASGFYLGVMSNRFEPYRDYLNERGLGELFDLVVYAGEAGIRKPNPQVFHFMLEKAGFAPSAAVYVGDNYYADVVGARGAGMAAVLFDREKLFAAPDCPVITAHRQLFDFLDGRQ
jgi:HAD superfamily hydrolase (TIGR01549 family)